MRFASLGSGSEGNGLVVESGTSRILLDCGFSIAETGRRLERLGLSPHDLLAILVTHEHDDHLRGVFRFARRHGLLVYLTHGTYRAVDDGVDVRTILIDSHTPFAIGDLSVQPFTVPHDAAEPTQFVFGDGVRRLGVLTDSGASTPHIESMLSGCEALVLECNHDRAMLAEGPYSPALKNRVGGRYGHLDNGQAADLLNAIDCSRLQHIIAAHLSQRNNRPELAREALSGALGCEADWIGVAGQHDGFDWRMIA